MFCIDVLLKAKLSSVLKLFCLSSIFAAKLDGNLDIIFTIIKYSFSALCHQFYIKIGDCLRNCVSGLTSETEMFTNTSERKFLCIGIIDFTVSW